MALSEESIVKTALDLLNDEGLEAVSLRNIAGRLGVKAPSLSWHVKNKNTLIVLMKAELFKQAISLIPACKNAHDWLIQYGLALWRVERAHRDSARLIADGGPVPELDQMHIEFLASLLEQHDLNTPIGTQMQAGVQSYVIGWNLLLQSGQGMLPGDVYDVEEAFELGLNALVHGYSLPK